MKDQRVLITGGTGSLGHELTSRMLADGALVTVYSRDEKKQYDMKKLFPDCRYLLGDIRDYHSVRDAVRDIDIIVHGASLKYVNISELQPTEYVTTNVDGTINLVNAVLQEGSIQKCVGISTDKACLPVNTYGLTKALLEKIMLDGNRRQGENHKTQFNVARYGNVIGTRGSVIPFWKERREANMTLPITNPDMTRFFFTLEEAVDLIYKTLSLPAGLIVSKAMRSVTLGNLASVMKGDSSVELVGERPGEKHDEFLLSDDEMSRTIRDDDYFLYDPQSGIISSQEGYSSCNAPMISNDELKVILKDYL
jgi:UDP-N-acetylglucosamine 4,6-dehydratase